MSWPSTDWQDLLAVWKDADADPDIPILKQAKPECAGLNQERRIRLAQVSPAVAQRLPIGGENSPYHHQSANGPK